ncbi:hypothetical protein HPB48_016331 [Haemaphysalis longicornis]|uniref:DDE Tnp4 domain-containing protein n=1 Tax=Haemaphysalis longicornis TaxID=44386 RepID=A0A9J6G9D1_HAELO|nr:hypothetical protein HPB48_016331 [Haemaphysalis longicornis]
MALGKRLVTSAGTSIVYTHHGLIKIQCCSGHGECGLLRGASGVVGRACKAIQQKSYVGRCSDAFVTVDSGFLDLVRPGDVVLADKGFQGIKAGLEEVHVALLMPPFLQGHDHFTE